MDEQINPMTGLPWAGPKKREETEMPSGWEGVPEARGAADMGEDPAPPGLSDEVDEAAMDDEEPPEPHFLIRENAFGPGVHSVKFVDGTPVGQWLAHSHPRWRAERVLAELLERGLPLTHAEQFARRRAGRDRDTETLAALTGSEGMWAEFVQMEGERSQRLEPIRKAFLDAQKSKK